jgi:YjbE family integral membrane protein
MEFQTYVTWIAGPVQIAFLDLVLGADNAIIIALVCRTLPRYQRFNVMAVGTGAALLLRVVLTALTGTLMALPLIRIVGGIVLVLIAISLTDEAGFLPKIGDRSDDPTAPRDKQADSEAFWDAILLVVLADGIMSLDNTVALAAVAKGDVVFLVLGLLLSVPTLVFGSWLLAELLGDTPILSRFAMAILGWIAGDMVISDPLIAGWIATQAPALVYAVPLAMVILVLAKVAFKPVIVPIEVSEPLTDLTFAEGADGDPTAATKPAPAVEPDAAIAQTPDPTPASVLNTLPNVISHADISEEVPEPSVETDTASLTPQDMSSGVPRPAMSPMVERVILGGFIVLFTIAAILIGVAIYFGSATF